MPVEMCGDHPCDFSTSGTCRLAEEVRNQLVAQRQRLTRGQAPERVQRAWKSYRSNATTMMEDCKDQKTLQKALDDTTTL